MRKLKGLFLFAGAFLISLLAHAMIRGPFKILTHPDRRILDPNDGPNDGFAAIAIIIVLICLVPLGVILYKVSKRLRRLGKRGFAPLAEQVLSKDTRRPLLLLRAFDDDERFMVSGPWLAPTGDDAWIKSDVSLEEALVKNLKDYGPVIAIGRPGEWAPPLGAARKYVVEAWKDEVFDLIRDCRLIVVILGSTDGLAWELQQLLRLKVLNKVILVLPPVDTGELKRRWTRFMAIAGRESMRFPNKIAEQAVLVTFGEESECEIHYSSNVRRSRLFGGRRARNYVTPLKAILRRDVGKPNRPVRRSFLLTFIGVATLILGGLLFVCGAVSFPMAVTHLHETNGTAPASHDSTDVVLTFCSGLSFIWGAIAIPAGIGVLMRREWGRKLCLMHATLGLVIGGMVLASLLFGANEVCAVVIPAFYTLHAALVFIIMLLPSTKRKFPQQAIPLP